MITPKSQTLRVYIKPFIGVWKVAYDQSLEEVKKSPKYKPGDAEKMPAMIKRLMETLKIKISENRVTYLIGSKEQSFDIDVNNGDRTMAQRRQPISKER